MKELSVFVDESGDFGEYEKHSPYYLITLVLHDQKEDISAQLAHLETELSNIGFPEHYIHTGPIIRKEEEYRYLDLEVRQKLMKRMMGFVRRLNIQCSSFYIEKRKIDDPLTAVSLLSKQIASFIKEHLEYFVSFDVVKVYYDNGQVEVNKILASVFNTLLENVEFRKVLPSSYRLFQVADLICTIRLAELKLDNHQLSSSERRFFKDERTLKKNYIKPIKRIEL